ncbi:MAG: DUF1343 domain-containing protein [Desulfobacteraceae bacterium]|nr:MAG: DUF1343 domain-containing protein [Desulfobacteraceae bacterium]
MNSVSLGIDVFREGHWRRFKGRSLGLLSNQASLDSRLDPSKRVIDELLPGHLKALFGPQHGHGGAEQDNMVETGHAHDPDMQIPVFSLYSDTREPLDEMLAHIDTLLIDLQDVGTRVYTFYSTMLNCLKAASRAGKNIVILDRPNPLGGEIVEGRVLKEECYSFVGPFALPMRHGLTMAELAGMFRSEFGLSCSVESVPMAGWKRGMLWKDTGLRWLMPSPNMPLPETALVYPGQVLWEGTNISEGRGTTRPFEMFGAPFLELKRISEALHPDATRGCLLQEVIFRPMFHKWKEETCNGFMIHITDPALFRSTSTSLALLGAIMKTHPDRFAWRSPPYEYEYERMPIDLILGDVEMRESLQRGEDPGSIVQKGERDIQQFLDWRKPFLMYD